MQTDIAQGSPHQFLHMNHTQLLQQAAQTHVSIVAASNDQYQHGCQQTDIESLHGCLTDEIERLLRGIIRSSETNGVQRIQVIFRLTRHQCRYLVLIQFIGQVTRIRTRSQLQQCKSTPEEIRVVCYQHVKLQKRLFTLLKYCRHFVRTNLSKAEMCLHLLSYRLFPSEKATGTSLTQRHLPRLTEYLTQTTFFRTVIKKARQGRIGRQHLKITFHLLLVHLAVKQIQFP